MQGIPGLYYKHVENKRRGVFCLNEINPGDIIEVCPVILIPEKDLKLINETRLHDYYFLWEQPLNSGAIALGYGSLYNHSTSPNAKFELDYENDTIDFICGREIPSGEEITVDYHAGISGRSDLWFDIQ